jgi:predicted TIM-barrel fold metal-dependent hydrolase
MTQDEINQLVEQAGFHGVLSIGVVMDAKQLEAFAKLVAEKERERISVIAMDAAEKAVDVAIKLEREACAKIADEWAVGWPHPSQVIAERIRARGQA